jgi:hypothetical protein
VQASTRPSTPHCRNGHQAPADSRGPDAGLSHGRPRAARGARPAHAAARTRGDPRRARGRGHVRRRPGTGRRPAPGRLRALPGRARPRVVRPRLRPGRGGVHGLELSAPVAAEGVRSCAHCVRWKEGRTDLCAAGYAETGFTHPGALAEAMTVPAALVHPLPAHRPLAPAALLEPAACAANALLDAGPPPPAARPDVVGDGPLGADRARPAAAVRAPRTGRLQPTAGPGPRRPAGPPRPRWAPTARSRAGAAASTWRWRPPTTLPTPAPRCGWPAAAAPCCCRASPGPDTPRWTRT